MAGRGRQDGVAACLEDLDQGAVESGRNHFGVITDPVILDAVAEFLA
jgi:hypothetical protein